MRRPSVLLVLSAAVLLGAGVIAHQEVFPTPRSGSGVVTVTGTVDIGAMPELAARQSGEWVVDVNRMPQVSVAGAPFVRSGARYAITWPDGATERVTASEPASGAWVRVQNPGGSARWVNLAAARAVEEAP